MNYEEAVKIAKNGKTLMLPNFTGYFNWDFGNKTLMFKNGDYKCLAEELDIKNRQDFFYII